MGCGGSRADTIEPRYYESWTRETESTWLANTDTDVPLPVESNALDKATVHVYSSKQRYNVYALSFSLYVEGSENIRGITNASGVGFV